MRIMLVYDLAAHSTRDCGRGLHAALTELGHDVRTVPVWAYADYLLSPWGGGDPAKMPLKAREIFSGTVNKIILADLLINEPDAVIVVSGWVMARLVVDMVRNRGVHMALYLTESPYQDAEQVAQEAFGGYDTVFCNELSSIDFIAEHHPNVVYLPHSYNPQIHRPMAGEPPPYDVYMCGTGFTERRSMVAEADWAGVRVRLDGWWKGDNAALCENVQAVDEVRDNHELPLIYSTVPINLNIHRTTKTWLGGSPDEQHITHAKSIGPRVFEVLACGGFLLTDYRDEMNGFLDNGIHLATFVDARELGDLARHYLQHGDERARIAAAGRAAVADCTFGRRCEQYILPILETKGVTIHGS